MISKVEDYEYVVGDNIDDEHPHGDMDRILINGEIMPLRTGVSATTDVEAAKIMRGEDICFLLEWLLQRDWRSYNYWDSTGSWSADGESHNQATFTRQLLRVCNANGKKNNVWKAIAWMGWLWGDGDLCDGWPHLCFFTKDALKSVSGELPGTTASDILRVEYFIKQSLEHVDLWAKEYNPYQGGAGTVVDNGICLTQAEIKNYFAGFAKANGLGYGTPPILSSPPKTLKKVDGSQQLPTGLSSIGWSKSFLRTRTSSGYTEVYQRFIQYQTPGNYIVELTLEHATEVVMYVAFVIHRKEKNVGGATTTTKTIICKSFAMTQTSAGAFAISTDTIGESFVTNLVKEAGIDVDGWTASGSGTGRAYLAADIYTYYFPIVWHDDHTSFSA